MRTKRVSSLVVLLVLLLGLAVIPAAASGRITTPLNRAPDPPWCYPDTPWTGPCPLLEEDYPDAGGTLDYYTHGFSFTGFVKATDLIPDVTYQLKLEGKPTCKYGPDGNDEANLNIGYIGRWWNDTKGWNESSDAAAEAAMAAGDCVLGYIVFDCATADAKGRLRTSFDLDYSWHTCGSPERGEVRMPDGDYDVSFVVTENPSPWRTILITHDVHFTVDHLLDLVDVGSGDGYEEDNPRYVKYMSHAVCPTETGGNYGGIASDPDSPDGECRLVWAHDFRPERPDASLFMYNDGHKPTKLVIRVLDGMADDSFDVFVKMQSGYVHVYSYADQHDTETWVVHEIPLPDGDYRWTTRVKIVATGPQWELFDTYGQLAVDWIALWK